MVRAAMVSVPAAFKEANVRSTQKIIACLLVTVVSFSAAGLAFAQSPGRTFFVNNTNSSVSIQRVWYSPSGTPDPWIEARMSSPIYANQRMGFTMPGGDNCFFDVKVQFSDGYVQNFDEVNFCSGQGVRAT